MRWFLSINNETFLEGNLSKSQRTYRSITIKGKEIQFSDDFFYLHSESYKSIIEKKEFGWEEGLHYIEIMHEIRNKEIFEFKGDYHSLINFPLVNNPFKNGNSYYSNINLKRILNG